MRACSLHRTPLPQKKQQQKNKNKNKNKKTPVLIYKVVIHELKHTSEYYIAFHPPKSYTLDHYCHVVFLNDVLSQEIVSSFKKTTHSSDDVIVNVVCIHPLQKITADLEGGVAPPEILKERKL